MPAFASLKHMQQDFSGYCRLAGGFVGMRLRRAQRKIIGINGL